MNSRLVKLQRKVSRGYDSYVVTIPKEMVEKLGWKAGDELEVKLRDGKIVIVKPSQREGCGLRDKIEALESIVLGLCPNCSTILLTYTKNDGGRTYRVAECPACGWILCREVRKQQQISTTR